jgi:hypothetical protein
MSRRGDGPEGDSPDGLAWGLWIYRWFEPRQWVEQLAKVPADLRPVAEQYLRDMATRLRRVRESKAKERDE